MKPDIYTKAVLTVIARLLAVIAYKVVIRREPAPSAQPALFAGVEFMYENSGLTFFDTRTGEIWEYFTPYFSDDKRVYGHVARKLTLTKLGEPVGVEVQPAGVRLGWRLPK